jgi:hypothetical protein
MFQSSRYFPAEFIPINESCTRTFPKLVDLRFRALWTLPPRATSKLMSSPSAFVPFLEPAVFSSRRHLLVQHRSPCGSGYRVCTPFGSRPTVTGNTEIRDFAVETILNELFFTLSDPHWSIVSESNYKDKIDVLKVDKIFISWTQPRLCRLTDLSNKCLSWSVTQGFLPFLFPSVFAILFLHLPSSTPLFRIFHHPPQISYTLDQVPFDTEEIIEQCRRHLKSPHQW